MDEAQRFYDEGSSPLTRGTPPMRRHLPRPAGLIPAHAGNTYSSPPPRFPSRAHPRSRGEHDWKIQAQKRLPGSSPLTRGTRHVGGAQQAATGLIPAHAGNTVANALNAQPWWGSSPLTRGTPAEKHSHPAAEGLIPAHAGNTDCAWYVPWAAGAHPRSRGEHGLWFPAECAA